MCIFFFCTDETGDFNKEFAGFDLLNLLCGDWEDAAATCCAGGSLWSCESWLRARHTHTHKTHGQVFGIRLVRASRAGPQDRWTSGLGFPDSQAVVSRILPMCLSHVLRLLPGSPTPRNLSL